MVQKLTEYGLCASAEQATAILASCRRQGAAKRRALTDSEFLTIAEHLWGQEL